MFIHFSTNLTPFKTIHLSLPTCRDSLNISVLVKVGMCFEDNSFHVHKTLLCDAVANLRACLEGNFEEASKRGFELAEDNPLVFKHFQLWL